MAIPEDLDATDAAADAAEVPGDLKRSVEGSSSPKRRRLVRDVIVLLVVINIMTGLALAGVISRYRDSRAELTQAQMAAIGYADCANTMAFMPEAKRGDSSEWAFCSKLITVALEGQRKL